MDHREEHLVPIGRFSQLTRLSLKALRLYDDNGLLRPALVDADTGYRYYRPEQRRRASLIRLLRSLEMPLEQIRDLLDADAGEEASGRLNDWWAAREASIAAGRRTVLLIQRLLRGQEETMGFEVKVKDVPTQPALSRTQRLKVDRLEAFITGTIEALVGEADRLGAQQAGPPLTVFHGEVNTESDGPVEVCLPLDRAVDAAEGFVTTELTGGPVAYTMVDVGHADFPEILEAYDAVGRFIEARGHEMAGSPRELYLVPRDGYPGAAERGEPVFEIDWPIR
jgi:DNA-binding transcriptional MerR regulator